MVPQGYKQTEVGIIPDDWSIMQLGDIGTFSKGSGISKDESNSGNIPCVRYGEIYTIHDFYIKKYHSFISEDIAKQSKLLKAGDILFAASGETKEDIGKCVAFLSDCKAYAGGDIIILTPKAHSFDSKYLGYILNTSEVAKQKASKGQGDAVVHITTEALADLIVPIPPIIEVQRRIAEVLSDVDGLITALDKKIAKKKLIKQAAMQQLLTGKKRLQGFFGEWETNKLGDISHIKTGKRNGDEQIENGKYPFFVRSNIVARIDSYSFDGEAILVPGEGGIGSIFHYVNGKFDYHQRVYKISNFIEGVYGKYIYYYMQRYFGEYAMSLTVKATVDSLRLPTFEEFKISIPTRIEEQQAIATILSDMDAEISDLERKRDKYKLLKNGMMQKLLTGQIRIK